MNSDLILKNIDSHSIIVTDMEGKITYFNKGAEKIFGYSADEMIGQTPAILYPDVDMASLAEDLGKIMQGIDYVGTWLGRKKDKEVVILEIKTTLLKDDDGNIQGFIGFAKNVTQKVKNEEIIKSKEEIIKHILQSKIDFKTDFLAQMSHEIRTPLNGLLGTIDLFDLTSDLNEQQKDMINTMKQSSNLLLNIVNDVLDLSKFEAGKFTLKQKANNFKTLFDLVRDNYLSKAKHKKIALDISNEINDDYIFDEIRLRQVMGNLVSNAIKFTEEGSVTIKAKIIADDDHKSKLEIGVKDTGTGISKEDQKKLFKKYSQLENASLKVKTGSEYGTGLGLNICQKLLGLYDSELQIEAEVGEGSYFYFTLTLDKASVKKKEDTPINDISILENKKVLIVEDKIVNQRVAQMLLKTLKVNSDIAENGKIAVEILQEKEYDLILMDIQMPIMDGLEATKILKSQHKIETPIIALTAHVLEDSQDKFTEAGMDDFIPKPINRDALITVLTKHIK